MADVGTHIPRVYVTNTPPPNAVAVIYKRLLWLPGGREIALTRIERAER